MSPRHFERTFKEAIGRSPKRFLIEVRVGAAQALLAQTDQPISAIAVDVGFSHASHFAETFQKLTGQTPRAYRQSHR
jgi:transcriptional regulator GlxA family with amidase domain